MSEPVGVILAAGLATRMGRPKQLLPYGSTTVLGAVVATASGSRLGRVVVVLGAHGEETVASVDLAGCDVVHNPEPESGNLSSLLVATAEIEDSPVLLMMGDMPGLDASVIEAHLAAWEGLPAWLRFTEYSDRLGHPFMLSEELVATLATRRGPKPLWEFTESPRAKSVAIKQPMPVDIDTPEDYGEALARNAADP